jgi:hypothetical protein
MREETNVDQHQIAGHPNAGGLAVVPQPTAAAARQSPSATAHHVTMVVIGLAAAVRLARDNRTYERAIVALIALAAAASLARAGRARSFARLAAWDKRRTLADARRRGRDRAERRSAEAPA